MHGNRTGRRPVIYKPAVDPDTAALGRQEAANGAKLGRQLARERPKVSFITFPFRAVLGFFKHRK